VIVSFDPDKVERFDSDGSPMVAKSVSNDFDRYVLASDFDALLADYKALERQNEQLLEAMTLAYNSAVNGASQYGIAIGAGSNYVQWDSSAPGDYGICDTIAVR
jgi:hypothetical protein